MIYVVTHKKFEMSLPDGYKVLNIGTDDCVGDNIGYKNANYCELTGLYSLYKNSSDEYVGLVHYRRFFADRLSLFDYAFLKSPLKPLSFQKAKNILKDYDFILPQKQHLYENAYDDYKHYHCEEDLILTRDVLITKYPEYGKAFDVVMDRNTIYPCNMIISSKQVFDDYCKWLFDILFEVENQIDLTKYGEDKYNSRVFGFLSERLLNVYVEYNKSSVCEMPIVFLGWKPYQNSLYYRRKINKQVDAVYYTSK